MDDILVPSEYSGRTVACPECEEFVGEIGSVWAHLLVVHDYSDTEGKETCAAIMDQMDQDDYDYNSDLIRDFKDGGGCNAY